MIITVIDNEIIAKTCSRTFMKFNLSFKQNDRTFDDFATTLWDNWKVVPKNEFKAYQKLIREFKKKTGIEVKLSKTHSYNAQPTYYLSPKDRYKNSSGEVQENMKFNKPLWITELKLAPELNRLKATVIEVK